MSLRAETRMQAPPLGHFVTKAELELIRSLLRQDLAAADAMLMSVLSRRPRMAMNGEAGG